MGPLPVTMACKGGAGRGRGGAARRQQAACSAADVPTSCSSSACNTPASLPYSSTLCQLLQVPLTWTNKPSMATIARRPFMISTIIKSAKMLGSSARPRGSKASPAGSKRTGVGRAARQAALHTTHPARGLNGSQGAGEGGLHGCRGVWEPFPGGEVGESENASLRMK